MIKISLKCPICGGNLKVDTTRHIITEIFVLAPPIEPTIEVLFCEKCGKTIKMNPADIEQKINMIKGDTLCIQCKHSKTSGDYIACKRINVTMNLKEKVIECEYFERK